MSCATKIPVEEELQSTFRAGATNGSVRFIVVRIRDEVCYQVHSEPATGSLQSDWGKIADKAGDAASYVLVCTEPGKWVTITYVPPGTRIKDKMVYAATKSTLLNKLGFQHFVDELHANDRNELSWENYQGTLKPSNAFSASEIARSEVDREEEEERQWRIQQARARGGRGGGGGIGRSPASAVASAARGRGLGAGGGSPSRVEGGRPASGFHTVQIPFSDGAKANLQSFASGSANFVELEINASNDGLESGVADTVTPAALGSKITAKEPRFYFYKFRGQTLFLYCCPSSSTRALRMVYSTAKNSVVEQARGCNVNASKSLEVADRSEVTEQYLSEALNPPRASAGSSPSYSTKPSWANRGRGGNRPSSSGDRVGGDNAHPIYSMMGRGSNRTSKKIVLPPKGAW